MKSYNRQSKINYGLQSDSVIARYKDNHFRSFFALKENKIIILTYWIVVFFSSSILCREYNFTLSAIHEHINLYFESQDTWNDLQSIIQGAVSPNLGFPHFSPSVNNMVMQQLMQFISYNFWKKMLKWAFPWYNDVYTLIL